MGTHLPHQDTMQLLLLLSLAATTSAFYDPPENCKNKDSCAIDQYIQQIRCNGQHGDTSQACVCKDPSRGDCGDPNITNKDMTKEECKKRCEDLAAPAECFFYRWDKVAWTNVLTCTLMGEGQCATKGDPCGETDKGCESGAVEEKCEGSDDGGRPEGDPCDVSLPAVPEPAHIHWKCIDPYSKDHEDVVVYAEGGTEVLHGVQCETQDRCTQFGTDGDFGLYLKYTCNNTEWIGAPDQTTPEPPVITEEDKKLSAEPTCAPADLAVPYDNLKPGEGGELLCSTAMERDDGNLQWLIKPPNTCALLCDKHHVVTVQSGWVDRAKGKAGWNLYVVGQPDPSSIEDGSILKCWDRRRVGQ